MVAVSLKKKKEKEENEETEKKTKDESANSRRMWSRFRRALRRCGLLNMTENSKVIPRA